MVIFCKLQSIIILISAFILKDFMSGISNCGLDDLPRSTEMNKSKRKTATKMENSCQILATISSAMSTKRFYDAPKDGLSRIVELRPAVRM